MPRPLKIWNVRGNGSAHKYRGGRFYVAAPTKKDAATMLAQLAFPYYKERPTELPRYINGALHELSIYGTEGCWGNQMIGITPERGVWFAKDYNSKPEKIV